MYPLIYLLAFLEQQRNEMIAHLKDQLQEMKAKASMEGKYIRKDAEVRVDVTQKKCQQTETSLKQEREVCPSGAQKHFSEFAINLEYKIIIYLYSSLFAINILRFRKQTFWWDVHSAE